MNSGNVRLSEMIELKVSVSIEPNREFLNKVTVRSFYFCRKRRNHIFLLFLIRREYLNRKPCKFYFLLFDSWFMCWILPELGQSWSPTTSCLLLHWIIFLLFTTTSCHQLAQIRLIGVYRFACGPVRPPLRSFERV